MSLRVGLIGAVKTSALTLEALLKHGFEVVGVLGHEPARVERVSGWVDLGAISRERGVDYQGYQRINEAEHLQWMAEKQIDLLFAVGFSQLLSTHWLEMPRLGCIGFHPTLLPQGRGRAPLAWIVLDRLPAAANFFLMGEGADDGPIFVQEAFHPDPSDDAGAVESKLGDAIVRALDRWLPLLKKGEWNPRPQDESLASWYGKRAPEDGRIDWSQSADAIDRLIKASASPHPGAYTWFKDTRMTLWASEVEAEMPIKGVVGRVLLSNPQRGLLVQCGQGLIWLNKFELSDQRAPGVGDKLGVSVEDELMAIKEWIRKQNR